MDPVVLSQLATGLSVLAGAALVKSVMDQNPMTGPTGLGGSFPPRCPTCNGTGRVTCLCSRWSDGDLGCRTCAGSGRMGCNSCGGSGTGRPIRVRLSYKDRTGFREWSLQSRKWGLGSTWFVEYEEEDR